MSEINGKAKNAENLVWDGSRHVVRSEETRQWEKE